jgi:hypothetical protein
MSQSSKRGAITYEIESAWAEDIDTTATLRLAVLGSVDTSGLIQTKLDPERVTQRRNELTPWILGTMEGSFKTRLYLTGHGSSVQGAVSLNGHETLLGYVFGASLVSSSAGTTASGGSATAFTTAAASGFAAGSIGVLGIANDARGNGQPFVTSSHAGNTLTSLVTMDAAPSGTDLVRSGAMIHCNESPTTTSVQSLRFLLQTANLQYLCHGCFASAVAFSPWKAKERPWIEITWTVSWYEYKASTFPNTTATETFMPAPIAGGSVFMNTVGTATRVKYAVRDFQIDYTLGVEPLEGPGGVSPFQTIVGAVRTPDEIKVSFVGDADAATLTPVLPGLATGTNQQHILFGSTPTEQKTVAGYWPNVHTDSVATQMQDGGINRLRYTGRAGTGTTTTSELTMSAQRLYLG